MSKLNKNEGPKRWRYVYILFYFVTFYIKDNGFGCFNEIVWNGSLALLSCENINFHLVRFNGNLTY